MKILEGWARGVPVIATPAAASGLEAHHGRQLLIANDARSFCAAVAEVQRDRARVASLVEAGRALLRQRHQPESVAKQLEAIYKPKKVAVDREAQQRRPTPEGRQA
jgi:glycosyltransferase involved in cell wall biosynthesis